MAGSSPSNPQAACHSRQVVTGSPELDKDVWRHLNEPPLGQRPIKLSQRGLGGVGGIRISTHFFNTQAEIDELVRRQGEFLASKRP